MKPTPRLILFRTLFQVLIFERALTSHFRGAIISWKAGARQNEIIINFRISWRMTYSNNFFCNDQTIQSNKNIGGEGSIDCFSNCQGTLGQLDYQCTDFSINEDWSSGRGRLTAVLKSISLPPSYAFEFGFSGNAWINTLNYGSGGNWRLLVKADLSIRSDTSEINSSPTAEISPIIRLQYGCNHTIVIPVNDADNDIVRCFWATDCGSVCRGFPNSFLDEKCVLKYEAKYQLGWFAVAIQVEDYINANATTSLSSIPVQFLVNVYQSTESCAKTTIFIKPTPPEQACVGVPVGHTFESAIVARVSNASRSVSEILTISPVGLTKSALYKISPTDWRVNITFTPTALLGITNSFCFTAQESSGLESERRCITFLVGVSPPTFNKSSQSPSGKVYPSQRSWKIFANSDFVRASRPSYIRMYNSSMGLLESIDASDPQKIKIRATEPSLEFTTTSTLIEKQSYYFGFDFGVIKGNSNCGPESYAIDDPSFWNIQIRDVTPPSISWMNHQLKTNSTAYFLWAANEPVTTMCTLTRPNGTNETFSCDKSWTETSLAEGQYRFRIDATDLEQNRATQEHVWRVDTSPPVVTLFQTPANISNQNVVQFSWTCPQPCTTSCVIKGLQETFRPDCSSNSLSWQIPANMSNVIYTLTIEAVDDVGNQATNQYKWKTDFIAPYISFCTKGQNFTVDCSTSLKPETICNVTASDDIDSAPTLNYTDSNYEGCYVLRTWTTMDKAGNVAVYVQKLSTVTQNSILVASYPRTMSIACGALEEMTTIIQSMFSIKHPCNLDVKFRHNDNSSGGCGSHIQRNWTIFDDCGKSVTITQLLKIHITNKPLSPEDGQTGVELNTYLRWPISTTSTTYEVYFWLWGKPRPTSPTAVVYGTSYWVSNLTPGTRYSWQVIFIQVSTEQYLGPVWVFETRDFADLTVSNISVPSTRYTGQDCVVKWTVQNIGGLATQYSSWEDFVYISWDDNFHSSQLVARVYQRNILYKNDGYSATAMFVLEERKFGNAFVFVCADCLNAVVEYNKANNIKRSLSAINIQLTPPPDLRVSSIKLPGTKVYSGTDVTFSWTVVNSGEGPTTRATWFDSVYWSSGSSLGNDAKHISTVQHTGNLQENANYTQTLLLHIPEFITGNFFVIIQVDVYDDVYEYISEENIFPIQTPIYVALTQPPDLEVTTILNSQPWSTATTQTIFWTVENIGNDSPMSQIYWEDSVFLVSENSETFVGASYHYGVMISSASYTSSVKFYVPQYLHGNFNITVTTDYRDNLFEYTNENNNILSHKVTIIQELPDLKTQNFTISLQYDNDSTIAIAYWEVTNVGVGNTLSTSWTDTVYVKATQSRNYYVLKDVYIGRDRVLGAGQSYTHTESVTLPYTLYGDAEFMVNVASGYTSIGDTTPANNIMNLSNIHIKLSAPDLTVINLNVNENIQGGQDITVIYTVQNIGNRNIHGLRWQDRIYIAKGGEEETLVYMNELRFFSDDLSQNSSYTTTVTFKLSFEMYGSAFVIVYTNQNNYIFEGGKTQNNKAMKMIFVEPAPVADLSVTYIRVNTLRLIGHDKVLSVDWMVKNIGNSMNKFESWQDVILMKNEVSQETPITLNVFTTGNNLESQSTYKQNKTIVVSHLDEGNISLCVNINAYESLYEGKSRENNIMCTNYITLARIVPATLLATITNITLANDKAIAVDFFVKNTGELPTDETSWIDSLYVSGFHERFNTEKEIRRIALPVQDILHVGSLHPNQTYFVRTTLELPKNAPKDFAVYVLVNNSDSNEFYINEESGSINTSISDTYIDTLPTAVRFNVQQNVTFNSNVLPNLGIESNTTFANVSGGQPLTIEYEIFNSGNVTVDSSWYDVAYLSDDFMLDAFDTKLKSVLRALKIDENSAITVNISFILPLDLETKSYFLVIVCDFRDEIYEEDEGDNEIRMVINIAETSSTDIMVSQVVGPLIAEYGKEMNVTWQLINHGIRRASGYKCDSVYLSEDTLWDFGDAQVGQTTCSYFTLSANGSQTLDNVLRSATPTVTAKSYHTLVKSRSNVIDIKLDNNVGVGRNETKVVYTILALDSMIRQVLPQNGFMALQIVNVSGERTLVVNVTSELSDVYNYIYVKAGGPATLYDFDKMSENPNSPNQVLSVPNTIQSDYYVLIQNSGSLKYDKAQAINITVKYAQFEILGVFPNTIIPNAQTTLHLRGAQFPVDAKVSLTNNNVLYESIKTYVFSPTDAYATFYIPENATLSNLTVQFTSITLNKTAFLLESITVKLGTRGYLISSLENPGRLRRGETGFIFLNLQNAGDSDLLAPLIIVEASGSGDIKLIEDMKEHLYKARYFIFGSESNGPAGIMPPKAFSRLRFETKQKQEEISAFADMKLSVSVLKPSNDIPNPFIKQKDYFRPSHYDEQAWELIWKNFIDMTGNSTLSLQMQLCETLNEMSKGGRYVKTVDDIIEYLLEIADAPFGERTLVQTVDFDVESDANVRLVVDRYLSARIGSRSQTGCMGKGWILPLWDSKINRIDENILTLTIEKVDYNFVKLDDISYIHSRLGAITKTNTEFRHTMYKDDKEFHYDLKTLRLKMIASLIDDSYLKLQYDQTGLVKIIHSSGYFIDIRYDIQGRIEMMGLKQLPDASRNRQIVYRYDTDNNMLTEVYFNGNTIRYSYNYQDSSIKYMKSFDGSMVYLDYNNKGHLSSKRYSYLNSIIRSREYTYTAGGLLSVYSLPEDHSYNLTFDENGQVILIQRTGFLPEKTITTKTSQFQYEGDMVVTKQIYPESGDTVVIEDGNADRIQTTFNDKGQLIGFRDGEDNEYKIALNANGSLNQILFPDGTNETFTYFENGFILMTQNEALKRYEYNNKKQLVLQNIGNNTITTYSYNENGHLEALENENGRIRLTYNGDDIESITYPDDKISYTYNANGLVSSISSDSGYGVKYTYTDNGKLQEVKDVNNKTLLTANYSESGRILKKTLGNNASTLYSYDPITGLLLKMSNFFPNGTLASYFKYEYSQRMRRIAVETREGTWKFKYDWAGQVVLMTDPTGGVTEFTYDKRKNRDIVSLNGVQYKSVINKMSQYLIYGNNSYTYDKNGNMIRKNGTKQEYYQFDTDNKLVVFKTNEDECRLKYDAFDNLCSKNCSTETRYIVNPFGNYGSDIIEMITFNKGKKSKTHFYHGGEQIGLIASKHDDSSLNYYMYDPLGSVQEILSDNGNLLNRYQFDPFGRIIMESEKMTSPFTFVGQWGTVKLDELPGVFYMRSRMYDSYSGRFLSVDPYGLKAYSKNVYAYCTNNPVTFNDPDGKSSLISILKKYKTPFNLAKGAFDGYTDYKTSTDEFGWGGAAGAIIIGALENSMGSLWAPVISAAVKVTNNAIQHNIDNTPYNGIDAISDFGKYSAVGYVKLFAKVTHDVQAVTKFACQAVQHITSRLSSMCGVLNGILEKITPYVDRLVNDIIAWIMSRDPNDILGPTGFGAARFVQKNAILPYKIRFENDENATAPAQRVYIEYVYSENLDPRSFVMGEFGFGNFTKTVPAGTKFIQETIDLTKEFGLYVRVFAGLDLIKQSVVWEFQSLDPITGEAPINASVGFLPPNNGTTGEGYVTFSMKPKREVKHLSTIHANASIYFDQNEPMNTPNIFNTIDNSPPTVNGSIIAETETSHSVTLSLLASDSGSGVKYVDMFQLDGGSLAIFVTGIKSNFFHMDLKPGDSYRLLPIAVDQVGNVADTETFDLDAVLNVSSPVLKIPCDCSGNGNCSEGTQICVCLDRFYGPKCNSTTPPPEPPILELKSNAGLSNEPIELIISARNVSGLLDEMNIIVSGIPHNTTFSKGTLLHDGYLELNFTEFGAINMTTDLQGELDLIVLVIQRSFEFNFTRSGAMQIMVYPNIDNINIHINGCFKENDGSIFILLNSSFQYENNTMLDFNNNSITVPHTVLLNLPSWAHRFGTYENNGIYAINDVLINSILSLSGRFEPVKLSVTVKYKPDGVPSSVFSKEKEIDRFCEGDCDGRSYGIQCNHTCTCDWHNTKACSKFNGTCFCQEEWKGEICSDFACPCIVNNTAVCHPLNQTCLCKKEWTNASCDIDVNECTNSSICDEFPNTFCHNRDWGYDCLCLAGYMNKHKNGTCIECDSYTFGMNCNHTCECERQNTLECDRANGTCYCKPEWTGDTCHVDVDECITASMCDALNNTACLNVEWGYNCSCLVGYEPENDTCIESKSVENSTLTIPATEKVTHVTIRIDIVLRASDNLKIAVVFDAYKKKATNMLTRYYNQILHELFIGLFIHSLRNGSLIIDHDVITKNDETSSQILAVAIYKLATNDNNSVLIFDGKTVNMERVNLNNVQAKDDLCEIFMSLQHCATECTLVENKPMCKVAESPKDYTILIALVSAFAVAIICVMVIVAVICQRRRKSKRISRREHLEMNEIN